MKQGRDNKTGAAGTSGQPHLERQIPPLAHTSMYIWHKYWSRKTWNVVSEFIKNYCPEGGIVFDPFAGSGTTGIACKILNRNYILIEKEPEYIEIIKKRLSSRYQKPLWDE